MSEAIAGALIGALAAILGGAAGSLLSYSLDRRRYRQDQRKAAYEAIQRAITQINAIGVPTAEYQKAIENAEIMAELYAEKEIVFLYSGILSLYRLPEKDDPQKKQIPDLVSTLTKIMRVRLSTDKTFEPEDECIEGNVAFINNPSCRKCSPK